MIETRLWGMAPSCTKKTNWNTKEISFKEVHILKSSKNYVYFTGWLTARIGKQALHNMNMSVCGGGGLQVSGLPIPMLSFLL